MGGIVLPVSAGPAAPSLGHWLTGELYSGLLIAAPGPPSCRAIGWRRPTRAQLPFPVPGIGAISWHFSVAAVRGWCWILGAEACSDLRSVSTAVSELCRDSWEITKPRAHRSRDAQPPRSKFGAHVGPYSAHVALRRAHTLRSRVLIRQPGNTQRSDLLISQTATLTRSLSEGNGTCATSEIRGNTGVAFLGWRNGRGRSCAARGRGEMRFYTRLGFEHLKLHTPSD
ncbi:hypothetical protein Q8A67_010577 [Cirrhinus molitorella]|uniref:Uncharacterized protein n=1 Tax=Cirrhinus molitorella TaxID=172907 RepID=A0AA88TNK0_9TELE|nr:hypothetical protein Q8A67_010577 [Cirrhinus molitorella]